MKDIKMIKENNKVDHLRKLWESGKINTFEYFFRLKAEELNINTYKKKIT